MKASVVGMADRMPDRFGSLRTRLALLYSIVLFVLAAVMVGAGYETLHPHGALLMGERQECLGLALPEYRRHSVQRIPGGGPVPGWTLVSVHVEVDIRADQGCPGDHVGDVPPLRLGALQELPPRGHRVEEI